MCNAKLYICAVDGSKSAYFRATNIPNIDLFISMYVQKEALLSSQIEGTQATLEDIFNPNIDENINADVDDVVNYIKATKYAIKRLETLPLCNRLLLETHKVLLSGVREKEKNPGEFRQSQNWIGGAGSTIKTARYIPPDVLSILEKMDR
ncbi:Fic family protein [Helcococcus bovis]|uniref:Fic family protein n=1 Tax=Helcococcus bovis TaxID=3153252 RepID=UPI0038B999F3